MDLIKDNNGIELSEGFEDLSKEYLNILNNICLLQ